MAIVDSFSAEYQGAYSVGGFMKAYRETNDATGHWEIVTDPSGHMPRLPHGGDLQFVRIMIPVPKGGEQGPPAAVNLVAAYDGTGGNEYWVERTGVTGPSGGLVWPEFQQFSASHMTGVYTFFVEYGRVHSVPR